MKSNTLRLWIAFAMIVGVGAVGRLIFHDIPNFTPTVGVAVFAGLYFRNGGIAVLAPLAVMVISNLWFDPYTSWYMLAVVYAGLAFPAVLSHLLSRQHHGRKRLRPLGMLACGVLPSVFFFLTTNFAVWLWSGFYAKSLAGLLDCYVKGIPFYKYSLCSNLIFVAAALVVYELIGLLFRERQSVAIEP